MIMALRWSRLADQIDRDDATTAPEWETTMPRHPLPPTCLQCNKPMRFMLVKKGGRKFRCIDWRRQLETSGNRRGTPFPPFNFFFLQMSDIDYEKRASRCDNQGITVCALGSFR